MSVPALAQNYTPPPMFGGPVSTPVQPAPTPTPAAAPVKLDFEKRTQAQQEKNNLDEWGLINSANDIPVPILQTPNSDEQKKLAEKQRRERLEEQKRIEAAELQMKKDMERAEREAKRLYGGKIPPVSAEALLEFPVNAVPSPANDPVLKSSAAISQLPKPKEGEKIDDTGMPEHMIRRPEKPAELKKIEAIKPAPLPKKPRLKEVVEPKS